MCGIAGFLLNEISPEAADWLTGMTQRLYHRGMDDGGAVLFGHNGAPAVRRALGKPGEPVEWSYVPVKAGLGSRRLAIIDPSAAGHQPMASADERSWLSYNGEIYNHKELRAELIDRGMQFSGHCDTEVFLAAYRHWGTECFARFNGMWAAAIFDWAAGKLILTRDRLGIKPLYISKFKRGIAFASEIKAILTLPHVRSVVNEIALRDFLYDGNVDHSEDTFFENIWSVPSGCWIELNLRARSDAPFTGAVHRYWKPKMGQKPISDAPGKVNEALSEAVKSHLRSDVAVGSCLSGGLDSSSIVCLIDRLSRESQEHLPQWSRYTFTVSLPDTAVDETPFAQAVVDACSGLQSRMFTPKPEFFLQDVGALVWHQEQPFGSLSIYLQWEVMRLAWENRVKVLLDGQGGDELFCGYPGQIPPFLAGLFRQGRLVRFWKELRAAAQGHFSNGHLMEHLAAHLLPRGLRDRGRRRRNVREKKWLAPELQEADVAEDLCAALKLEREDLFRMSWRDDALSQYLWTLILNTSLPSLLRFEDRSSMAFGIEARVPFLDHRLLELAMSIPADLKIREGQLKAILRQAVKDVVPQKVLERRDKIGFAAPMNDWMSGGLRPWWVELLTSESFRERGCFEPKGVRDVISRFDKGDNAVVTDIWRMAIVEQWARQYLDHEEI